MLRIALALTFYAVALASVWCVPVFRSLRRDLADLAGCGDAVLRGAIIAYWAITACVIAALVGYLYLLYASI